MGAFLVQFHKGPDSIRGALPPDLTAPRGPASEHSILAIRSQSAHFEVVTVFT